jgi:hypothetical protein
MAASRDAGDDLVSDPALHPVGVEAVAADAELDDHADVSNVLPWDPDQPGRRRPAAEDPGAQHRTGEQGGDDRGRGSLRYFSFRVGSAEFEVVHCGDGDAVVIQCLPVQQVELGVQGASRRRRNRGQRTVGLHDPAPVTIIRGMAAREATRMTTR